MKVKATVLAVGGDPSYIKLQVDPAVVCDLAPHLFCELDIMIALPGERLEVDAPAPAPPPPPPPEPEPEPRIQLKKGRSRRSDHRDFALPFKQALVELAVELAGGQVAFTRAMGIPGRQQIISRWLRGGRYADDYVPAIALWLDEQGASARIPDLERPEGWEPPARILAEWHVEERTEPHRWQNGTPPTRHMAALQHLVWHASSLMGGDEVATIAGLRDQAAVRAFVYGARPVRIQAGHLERLQSVVDSYARKAALRAGLEQRGQEGADLTRLDDDELAEVDIYGDATRRGIGMLDRNT